MGSEQMDLALAKKRMPDDFDWVSARAAVRSGFVFNALADRIEGDVKKYEACSGSKCEFSREDDRVYVSVLQDAEAGIRRSAALELVYRHSDDDRRFDPYISVKSALGQPISADDRDCRAQPILQHDGEVMIEVDGRALALWQFSRLVLEPVFFPSR